MSFKFLSGKSDEYVYYNYKLNPFKFRFFTGIEKYNFDLFGPYTGGITFNNDITNVGLIEAPLDRVFYTTPSFTANYLTVDNGNIGIGVDPTEGQEYRETPYYYQFNNDDPIYFSSSRNSYSITLDSSATQGVVFHSGNNTFRIFAGDNNLEE